MNPRLRRWQICAFYVETKETTVRILYITASSPTAGTQYQANFFSNTYPLSPRPVQPPQMPDNPSTESPPAPIDVPSSQVPSDIPTESQAPAEVEGSSGEAGNNVVEGAIDTHATISEESKTRKSSDMSIDKDTTAVEAANTSSGSATHLEPPSADPQRDRAPSSIRVDKTETTETATATDEIDKDEKKDRASSLTITSTAPHSQNPPQTRASKRKANESTSSRGRPEKRAATSEANGKGDPLDPARPKRSFLSKLVRRLVPCVSPRGHTIDVASPGVHDGKAKPSEPSLKERQQDAEQVNLNGGARNQISLPSKEDSAKPLPEPTELIVPPPLTVPPSIASPSETDTILPPTPTKQKSVPLEPEAVTSSGVQPPGSTGDTSHHPHATRDSGDESDGTSFTDDDVDEVGGDEVEDEDERLVMNGGVGIPIGPVSVVLFIIQARIDVLIGWCPATPSATNCTTSSWTKMSRA
jgi:hypothetical protein